MWILTKMRFSKCEFCPKWDFHNVNFVKNENLKMWITGKMRFSDFQMELGVVNFWINWVFLHQCEFDKKWTCSKYDIWIKQNYSPSVIIMKRIICEKMNITYSWYHVMIASFSGISLNGTKNFEEKLFVAADVHWHHTLGVRPYSSRYRCLIQSGPPRQVLPGSWLCTVQSRNRETTQPDDTTFFPCKKRRFIINVIALDRFKLNLNMSAENVEKM